MEKQNFNFYSVRHSNLFASVALSLSLFMGCGGGGGSSVRFHFDETSKQCLDASGRKGLNKGKLGPCGQISNRNFSSTDALPSDLRGASFESVNFDQVDFTKSDLSFGKLKNVTIKNSRLSQVKWSGIAGTLVAISKSDLTESRISESAWSGLAIENSELKDADFSMSYFSEVSLKGSRALGAKFAPNEVASSENNQFSGFVFDSDTTLGDLVPLDRSGSRLRTLIRKGGQFDQSRGIASIPSSVVVRNSTLTSEELQLFQMDLKVAEDLQFHPSRLSRATSQWMQDSFGSDREIDLDSYLRRRFRGVQYEFVANEKSVIAAVNPTPIFEEYKSTWQRLTSSLSSNDVTRVNTSLQNLKASSVGHDLYLASGYMGFILTSLGRVATLIHEGRHAECDETVVSSSLSDYFDWKNRWEAAGLTASSSIPFSLSQVTSNLTTLSNECSFRHIKCPTGHDLAGDSACDSTIHGAYASGGMFMKAVYEACENCTEREKAEARARMIDSFNRIIVRSGPSVDSLLSGSVRMGKGIPNQDLFK